MNAVDLHGAIVRHSARVPNNQLDTVWLTE